MIRPQNVRDRLSLQSAARPVRAPMVKAISAIQDEPPEVQLLALAAALMCLAEAVGLNPHDIVSRVARMAADVDGPFSNQWQAMRDYARGELLK